MPQTIGYTSFESVATIGEGNYNAAFIYNSDNQRAKMDVTQSGTTTYYYLLRDYLGNITHQVNTSNVVVAEYSFDACSVKLGFCEWSETKTLVERIPISGAVREGRRRNPTDWSYTLTGQPELFAGRGFTSHEFLKYFNLLGRVVLKRRKILSRRIAARLYHTTPRLG